jgi:hypothetical protein
LSSRGRRREEEGGCVVRGEKREARKRRAVSKREARDREWRERERGKKKGLDLDLAFRVHLPRDRSSLSCIARFVEEPQVD